MRVLVTLAAVLGAGAGCRFSGMDQPTTDAPPGADAPIDSPPGTPDARIDAPPGTPDANTIDAPGPPDASPPDAAPTCPAGYAGIMNAPSTSVYRGGSSVAWLTAEQACEAEGTHLVVFDTVTEKSAIDAAFGSDVWIGMSDRRTEGVWISVTGQTGVYVGELGGVDTSQNCGRLKNANGHLEERDCAMTEVYVCECDGNSGSSIFY